MKKIVYASGVLAALSLTLFTGCKKDSEAFPTKAQSNGVSTEFSYITPYFPTIADADGILISAQVYDEKTVIVTPFLNTYEYGMAKFTNTQGNFSSLFDAGTIKLNDSTLAKANDLSYLSSTSTFSLGLSGKAMWQISGNNGVPSFNYKLNGVCPAYGYSIPSWDSKWIPIYPRTLYPLPARPTITHINSSSSSSDSAYYNANKTDILAYLSDSTTRYKDSVYNATNQYSVPIKNYVVNTDTVIIALMDASGFTYIRKVNATDSVANFKPNDFTGYPNYDITTFNFQVNAIKYQDTTIGAKNYYFLKMGSYIKYYNATK